MIIKIPGSTANDWYFLNTDFYDNFKKSRTTQNNVHTYQLDFITVTSLSPFFKSTNESEVNKCQDLIINKYSESRQQINASDFFLDITKFGIPIVADQPKTQNLSVGEGTGIPYAPVFHSDSGLQITYSATTSDSSIATVRLDTNLGDMVIEGVAIGSAVINLTATNDYGSVTTSLNVVVS